MDLKWLLIFIQIIFVLGIIMIGTNLLLNVDLTKSINLKQETNDYCQSFTSPESKNSLEYLACNNKFKKSKIILLLLDSLPFDKLHELTNLDESRIPNFFRGKGLDYKQSGALFENIFTGKFSRNYMASQTEYDTLSQQFKNANMNVFYKIKYFPLSQLINHKLFTKVEVHKGEVIPLSRFCERERSFFEKYFSKVNDYYVDKTISSYKNDLNEDILYKRVHEELNYKFERMHKYYSDCFAKNNFFSVVYFTDSLDHLIHSSNKNFPTVTYTIFYAEQVIKQIIKWINEQHGEYALAVASDHGGQYYYGEDALCNHGCNHPGNEAVLFVYTKELGENYEKYKIINKDNIPLISLNDFPCLIAQTLKDVNLPLESTCTPRYFGNDPVIKYSSIKSKEVQLKKYIEKLCRKYPELSDEYHRKYDDKLNKHKYLDYFKDMDSISQTEDKIFDEYVNYIMSIQKELLNDVIKSSHSKTYYIIFYMSYIFFIVGFFYCFRKLVLIIRNKILKINSKRDVIEKQIALEKEEDEKENDNSINNIILTKLVRYIIFIFILLLADPIVCLIFHNSLNISNYINYSIYFKFFGLLFLIIAIAYSNNTLHKKNYKKVVYILIIILISHLIMSYIELFIYIDKNVNNNAKSDFFKIYLSYPLLFIYAIIELYSSRNYYFYKMRYIYIIIPYLIYATYYMIKYDITVKQHMPAHNPEEILFMRRIYFMIILFLIFIKPFKFKKKEGIKEFSNVIFNTKLFFIAIINFICIETERVPMLIFLNFTLFYLCICFKKEKDIFLKLIYLIIISCYPQIFYIGNQGTYTMDLSIKIEIKVPAKYADDLPVVSGIFFTLHKLKYYIITSTYVFSLYKRPKNKAMNFYDEFARLIFLIQLFGIVIVFLFYLKREIEHSYIQVLFLIATKAIPLVLYDINFLINYGIYNILRLIFKKIENSDYKPVNSLEES